MNMNHYNKIETQINASIEAKKQLLQECKGQINLCADILCEALSSGNKIIFCGNGGSAADSQHLAAELVVRLRSHINRPALAAIALTVDTSIITAGGNDIGFDNIFSRQIEALGKPGDVLIGISTSGNSENVIRAVNQAKLMGIHSIGLLGGSGGKLIDLCDSAVNVPNPVTARIQECHILIGHIWCEIIEEVLFPELFEKQD